MREALRLLRRLPAAARGPAVADAFEARLRADLGFDPDGDAGGAEARERTASLALVLEIVRSAVAGRPEVDGRGLLADLEGAGRGGGGRVGRRREPADPPPGQGPRVGRGPPPGPGGGNPADPAGDGRRCARRGAPPPLRRADARPSPPRPVVGGASGRARRSRDAAAPEPVPAGPRGRGRPPSRRARRGPWPPCRPGRGSLPAGAGSPARPSGAAPDRAAPRGPARLALRPRPSRRRARLRRRPRRAAGRPSSRSGRARRRRSGGSRGWARPSSSATGRRSSPSSPITRGTARSRLRPASSAAWRRRARTGR